MNDEKDELPVLTLTKWSGLISIDANGRLEPIYADKINLLVARVEVINR